MTAITIMTDGSCDLPKELIEEYQIVIVPFKVIFGEEVYRTFGAWGDLTREEFYHKLDTSTIFPTSAFPGQNDFEEAFRKALERSKTVICIFLSKNFSGCYQAALQYAKNIPEADISFIDSGVATSTLGALVLEAAKMARKGSTKEEIIHRIEELKPQARLLVILDSVDAVYRSGRVGWSKKFLVSSFKIKPIVNFKDGLIVSGGTIIGAENAANKLRKVAPIICKNSITDTIFIWHVRYPQLANELKTIMEKNNVHQKTIIIQEAGPIVGTHVGKKSIGFMYIGPYDKKWLKN